MKFGMPWSVKGIRPEARETAREAARRSGMSLGDWLNSVILKQADESGMHASDFDDSDEDDGLSSVHQRLDEISRRIDRASRSGPAAYAPKRHRDNEQLAEMIARLDRRLDQFVNSTRPLSPQYYAPLPSAAPLPPALDMAVAEISARQRALNGQPPLPDQQPARPQPRMPSFPLAPPPMPSMLAPAPMQDISGLEDLLHRITDQIETLRKPGVEEAINALREELGEIAHTLNDAMPRRAIETIERQIAGLTQRIAEGRQAGIDGGALWGVEHGLAEVRDALRGLTPAENLVGFNDAVAALAHKIDQIVAQKDPTTFQQLDHSINTLREMAAHVASNEAVGQLADQVHHLSDKVDYLVSTGGAGGALNSLEQRIGALADALEQRAQSGGNVPPMLDALVHSLTEKIELIQQTRGDNTLALGHLEDRIVKLVERLDASDSRLGHLEAIERGLADLLVHIEDLRANKDSTGLRASPEVDALKTDMARTQSALEQVHGTLGTVVDRLATIEKGMRGGAPARPRPVSDEEFAEITQPVGKVAARVVVDAPPTAPIPPPSAPPRPQPAPIAAPAPPPPPPQPAPAPRRMPAAAQLPINPDLPPDEPLEPGSGPPPLRAHGARIADARPGAASPAGKSGFIAAARRAAAAAAQISIEAPPVIELTEPEPTAAPSMRDRLMKKVKTLFISASVIAIVVGSVQIIGRYYDLGSFDRNGAKIAKTVDRVESETATINQAPTARTAAAPTLAFNTLEAPKASPPTATPAAAPLAVPPVTTATIAPPLVANPVGSTPATPPLLNPPLLSPNSDVTGSIPLPTVSRPARVPAPAQQFTATGDLPVAIGGPRLRNAAVAGDAAAAFEIGARYAEGRGVPINLEEAARWYERAANKGLPPAQFRYASLLEKGQGVRKDLAQARRLYLAAAGKGNAKAMHNLAVLYAEGIEGRPDYSTAVLWFRKAAQHGIADSQYNLGVLCARGLGTAQSFEESYKWFALSAAQGDREATKKRDEIAGRLDATALAAAQREVQTFVPAPQPDEATVVAEPAGGWDRAANTPTVAPKGRPGAPLSLGAMNVGSR
jgi:localization factor PodJL